MSLTVGHITYANCAPFFHYLRRSGFSGDIISGVPAELNRLLADGRLDVCPSSSIEYASRAADYLLLPGHSISSVGPVRSVLLFSDLPMNRLDGVPITITGESATSVALLQVLLREFFQVTQVAFRREDVRPEALREDQLPMLLIGDRALKARRDAAGSCAVIDLGELWYHYTGLPFVFALWIVNRASAEQKDSEIRTFLAQLDKSRQWAMASLPEMARTVPEREWFGEEGLIDYWRQVSYDLDPTHIEGLNCYYLLLEKHGLIEKVPELEFFR